MKQCTILFLLLVALQLNAQTEKTSFWERSDFKIGYYGNLVFVNGLSIGSEYLWKERLKVKQRKKGEKQIFHQVLLNGSLGYATNFSTKTDNGLSLYSGLIFRRLNPKGKQINFELNPLGYYRSFLPETYEVKGEEVSKVFLPGRSYYAPSLAIGLGKTRKGNRIRTGWYFNLRCTLRTPYNAGVLPTFSLEYGHRFNFQNKK